MKHARERTILAAILLGVPVSFYLLIARPAGARIEALVKQRQVAEQAWSAPMAYVPVSDAERLRLQDPEAPWRKRLPVVQGDLARIEHYHVVVNELQRRWRAEGTPVVALRSSWDPIKASFTLPQGLAHTEFSQGATRDQPEMRVEGWVIEGRFEGETARLMKALAVSQGVTPLVEPVALRVTWKPDGTHVQSLALRNLTLHP